MRVLMSQIGCVMVTTVAPVAKFSCLCSTDSKFSLTRNGRGGKVNPKRIRLHAEHLFERRFGVSIREELNGAVTRVSKKLKISALNLVALP